VKIPDHILRYFRDRLGLDPSDMETETLIRESVSEDDPCSAAADDLVIDRLLRALQRGKDDALAQRMILAEVRRVERARRADGFPGLFPLNASARRLAMAIAASVVVCAALWWTACNALPTPVAVLEPYGKVWIFRGRSIITPHAAARLYHGDTVVTGERSRGIIRYRRHRTYISLRADSRIRLFSGKTGELAFLDTGSVSAGVAGALPGRGEMTLETPHARLFAANAAQFRLRAAPNETVVEVTDGKAVVQSLSPAAAAETVGAGDVVAVNGRPRPTPAMLGSPIIAQLRGLHPAEIQESLRMARMFGINTLAYDLQARGDKPPEQLLEAVAEAHRQGFLFYARVDLKALVAAGRIEPDRWIREHLAPIVAEYDIDGVYFYNGGDLSREKEIASILMPLYDSLAEALPGTAMLIGYSRGPSA